MLRTPVSHVLEERNLLADRLFKPSPADSKYGDMIVAMTRLCS